MKKIIEYIKHNPNKSIVIGGCLFGLYLFISLSLSRKDIALPKELKDKHVTYETVSETATKKGGRDTYRVDIELSGDSTAEQRAASMAHAALVAYNEHKPDVVSVRAFDNDNVFKSNQLRSSGNMGEAFLYSDACGYSGNDCNGVMWELSSSNTLTPTSQQKQIMSLWYQLRSSFQVNGSTDDASLKEEISKRLNIEKEQVKLFFYYPGNTIKI